mmetsp:Transcript_3953/g.7589  ORF Transcript_3953/g.7589 Transcript_3953/m.7589 type:complete len:190 (+) Transcript_3953:45-614(+)
MASEVTTDTKDTKRTVVVSVDDSPMTDHVLKWCARRILTDKDKVVLVHAVEYSNVTFLPGSEIGAFSGGTVMADVNEAIRKAAVEKGTKFLQECSKKLSAEGSAANELKLLLVHPSTSVKGAICDYTDDIKPDLVVCGSRGMGAMGRAFLGSTSDYLMHNAKCSTMIVKPPPSSESETTAGNDARLHCG